MNKNIIKTITIINLTILLSACSTMKFSNKYKPYPPTPEYKNINIAYVLGGGGARGLAHVGVIEELEKNNIFPDLIVGCSAGSIVGAMYAETKNINYVKQHILHVNNNEVLDYSLQNLPLSLTNDNSLQNFLRTHLKSRDFKQLKIPFISTATNFEFGKYTAMGNGDLINAVTASATFPGMFSPIKIDTQYYVDCGVIDNVPVQIAKEYNPKLIIAVDVSESLSKQPPENIVDIIKRSIQIAEVNRNSNDTKYADIIIKPELENIGVFSDDDHQKIYNAGRVAAKKAIPDILGTKLIKS